jgi:hypothetical protein
MTGMPLTGHICRSGGIQLYKNNTASWGSVIPDITGFPPFRIMM